LKAGLLALRRLGANKGDPQLRAQVELPYRVPISCLLDGIQFSTGCTVGNKRLSFRDSADIRLIFARDGDKLELILKQEHLDFLTPLFRGEQLNQSELNNLLDKIAVMNEDKLFSMKELSQSIQPTF
jgi:formylmethanofuran dehydrogenase subunit E